jgi:hypothetical protein
MTDERSLMKETVRGAIGDALATAGDIDAVLTELGWLELLGEQRDDAIEIVFGALGATNATATALDDVLASALGEKPRADLAVLLPRFATWNPPGRIEAKRLEAQGLATSRAATAREILIVCGTESEPCSAVVSTEAAEATVVHGVDPDAGLRMVRVRAELSDTVRLEPDVWQSALDLGRRAVAHQIEGACRTMLDLARTHAMDRIQFGRPIARFQAVRHRLADALVAVESLEAALTAAREEPNSDTAALAKAIAGRTAQTVARLCQQVLAGIGFTTEHSFHRFLKRVLALEGLFGSADAIVLDVGRRLLAERRVPTLIEL